MEYKQVNEVQGMNTSKKMEKGVARKACKKEYTYNNNNKNMFITLHQNHHTNVYITFTAGPDPEHPGGHRMPKA